MKIQINKPKIIVNPPNPRFVPLHLHTEYSELDGIMKISDLIDLAKKKGFKALAITDHGTMAGVLKFYLACKKEGIKPIIGEEFYICDDMNRKGITEKENEELTKNLHHKKDSLAIKERLKQFEKENNLRTRYHLTVLAKNNTGYKNLCYLSSLAYTEGYYYRPRIDLKTLGQHREGLIILSGCLASQTHRWEGNMTDKIDRFLKELDVENARSEDIYYEIQLIDSEDQVKYNEELINATLQLCLDHKLVLTNDIHFARYEDWEVQEKVLNMKTDNKFSLSTKEHNLKSSKELNRIYENYGTYKDINKDFYDEATENTLKIANMCNVEIPIGKFELPVFDIKTMKDWNGTETGKEYFLRKIMLGYRKKLTKEEQEHDDYTKRLKKEWTVTSSVFVNYFLIVLDVMEFARSKGYITFARGSVAGSLISYCLNITLLDPIKYNLIFERFLSDVRMGAGSEYQSPPDIDIDFDSNARPLVIEYLINKYGKENTCPIGSYSRMKIRNTIKNIARADGFMKYDEANFLTKRMYENEPIEKSCERDAVVRTWYEDPNNKAWFDQFIRPLIGQVSHAQIHPAGMVIAPRKLTEFMPVKTHNYKDVRIITSQWEDKMVEARGLLKLDVLALTQLAKFKEMVEEIKRLRNIDIDFDEIDLEEPEVYQEMRNLNTYGLFQMETYGFARLIELLGPREFEDLIALNAIARPGVKDAGMHIVYCERRNNPSLVEYDHPCMEKALKDSYGVCLYSESVMACMNIVGNLTLIECDKIRKAIKAFDKTIMNSYKEKFIKGAQAKHDMSEQLATSIWEKLQTFSGYGFPRAHSASYALYTYWCLWFKYHYAIEFFKAEFNYSDDDVMDAVRSNALKNSMELIYPDINISKERFIIKDNKIIFSLQSIKNLGSKVVPEIVKAQPYSNFEDFYKRVKKQKVNKKSVDSLIIAGVFDCWDTKENIVNEYYKLRKNKEVSDIFKNMSEEFFLFMQEEILGFSKQDKEKFFCKKHNLEITNYDDYVDKENRNRVKAFGKVSTVTIKSSGISITIKHRSKTYKMWGKKRFFEKLPKKNELVYVSALKLPAHDDYSSRLNVDDTATFEILWDPSEIISLLKKKTKK